MRFVVTLKLSNGETVIYDDVFRHDRALSLWMDDKKFHITKENSKYSYRAEDVLSFDLTEME